MVGLGWRRGWCGLAALVGVARSLQLPKRVALPVAWTIAGSDSGGGAGVEADLRAMRAMGVHGCSVVTSLTAQNSLGVEGALATPPDHVRRTIDALAGDLAPRAVKIGMLGDSGAAAEVARFLAAADSGCAVVVDPLLASSSGTPLIDAAGRAILEGEILPRATVATPNAPEAEALLGLAPGSLRAAADLPAAAERILEKYGCGAVLLKGGHLEGGAVAADYWLDGSGGLWLGAPRTEDALATGAHGTGCVLSSALAAALATGETPRDAAVAARGLVASAIARAAAPGARVGAGAPPADVPATWPPAGEAPAYGVPFASRGVPSAAPARFPAVPRGAESSDRAAEVAWLRSLDIDPRLRARLVAHRGFHDPRDGPSRPLENTLGAFEVAWAAGFECVECDVACTADGALVLSHDETFARLALDGTPVAPVSGSSLAAVKATPLKTGEAPALLVDALRAAAHSGGRLVVEIKAGPAAVAPLAALLGEARYRDRVAAVAAFDAPVLRALAAELGGGAADAPPLLLLTDGGECPEAAEFDGAYRRWEPFFMARGEPGLLGVWGAPDDAATLGALVDECGAAFVNTDLPRTFAGDPDAAPIALYALAPSADRCAALWAAGVVDVQLRVKGAGAAAFGAEVAAAAAAARAAPRARLWINDDWRAAAAHGAYGCHLGQEDLQELDEAEIAELRGSGLRLGLSTHCYEELAIAAAIAPSYVALGPVFGTTSKDVPFSPRGVGRVAAWRALIPSDVPLVAIGGISLENAAGVLDAGADGIAVISALPDDGDPATLRAAVDAWGRLWKIT